jgi:hypothetical protein
MAKSHSLIRRLTLSVLLPLFLLFTQQGALLHELSHLHANAGPAKAEVRAEAVSVDTDICLDCLGFGQVAGLAQIDLPVMPSLEGLEHQMVAQASRSVAEAGVPAARTRGPPLFS